MCEFKRVKWKFNEYTRLSFNMYILYGNMDVCLSAKFLFYTIPENKYPDARNKRAVGKIGN